MLSESRLLPIIKGDFKKINRLLWRTGWDSNPRAGVTDKLISSVLGLREVMRDNVKLGETKCI